ncbi:MAG TPA: MFS transporter [Actinocrinis sp.]|nr:MFS transporter [Actinocrinis sp.]
MSTTEPIRDDSTARGSSGSGDPTRWRALTVCLVAAFMTLLDVSIVNVALPSIRSGLHMSQSGLQWVLSGYALAFGLALVPAGRLGDARSRRAVFMVGLASFTIASALAGAARNEVWLVVARLVQGAAGGMVIPQVSGFIQEQFRGAERGKAFGLLGAAIGVSTAIGPLLGGLLIQLFGVQDGWRWVFYVNLPIGVAALPLAYRLLPRPDQTPADAQKKQKAGARLRDLDPIGTVLLGAGTVLLLLPFVEEQEWHSASKWLLLPIAAVLVGCFVLWERRYARHGEPVVNPSLFKARSYSLGSVLSLLYFAGFTAIFFIYTLYLQSGLNYSALLAGLAITPFAAGSGVSSAIGGRVVDRFGRPLVLAGLVLVLVGLGATVWAVHVWPGREVGWATALPLLVAGIGSGLVVSPNQALTLSEVPVVRAGSAGAVLQTGQRIGSAVGIAAVGSVFFSAVASTHGDWSLSFLRGMVVVLGFVFLALVAATVDVLGGREKSSGDEAAESSGSGEGAENAEHATTA